LADNTEVVTGTTA